MGWYLLFKKIISFWYFSMKINKPIRNRFYNKKHLQPTYQNDWFQATLKCFAAICNNRSSELSLRFNAPVEVTYPSSASTRDTTSYTPNFLFLFLIWLHAKHLPYFMSPLDILEILTFAPWCSWCKNCTASFKKAWT